VGTKKELTITPTPHAVYRSIEFFVSHWTSAVSEVMTTGYLVQPRLDHTWTRGTRLDQADKDVEGFDMQKLEGRRAPDKLL
jgi:hypothetical protein